MRFESSHPPLRRPYACILGVYGKGNLGDEALLLAITDAVAEMLPGGDVVVLGSDPEEVQRRFGIRARSRAPFPGFGSKFSLVSGAEVIILGGGTVVCDHGGFVKNVRAIVSAFFWPLLARLRGTPTLVYAQGLGPARQWPVRWAIRHLLPRMAGITLRDRQSGELMKSLAGSHAQFKVSCDPVVGAARFQADAIAATTSHALKDKVSELGAYCVISFRTPTDRPHNPESYYRECAEVLGDFHARHRLRLVLFPALLSDARPDDRLGLRIIERVLLERRVPEADIAMAEWRDLNDGVALLQNATLVVGDRLHALLFAAMAGVPVVGIDIEDKIPGCFEMIDSSRSCRVFKPPEVKSEGFLQALHTARAAAQSERAQLRARVERWASADECNRSLLAAMLAGTARAE